MLGLYYDPIFLKHDTGAHPENARRLMPLEQLELFATDARITRPLWQPASAEQLLGVHRADHVHAIRQFALHGGGRIEADTVLSGQSFDVALMAAGAVCDAVTKVVSGELHSALCLVRPPGHHALADRPMGFCLFNNVAIGARLACTALGLDRVLVVDWDVHHGNGTQAMFWEDPQVGFFSMHRYPFYPGTGASDETGAGKGLGTTLNVPVRFGTSRQEILETFANQLTGFAKRLKPQLVLISAGFDAHRLDPIGSLGLESEDFAALTQVVCELAQQCDGKIVSVLEGGYNPTALAQSVDVHWRALLRPSR